MTSEVNDHFYKDEDHVVNYMHKNFRNDIWAGLRMRRFQSYEFKWYVLIAKLFRPSKVNCLTIFFGHSMTFEVKDHFYKNGDNLVKYVHKNFRKDIWNACLHTKTQIHIHIKHILQ